MSNIWSSNKYVNIAVNILLLLLGINIFHYGQFLLPIICLILFVDRKYKFIVCDMKTFVVLCLFAMSYFMFSYKQGLYSVMGFCLPMAYYIGSNINECNETNIKKIIYIICLGMASHVLLNFGFDIFKNGTHLFSSSSHYDVWTFDKVSSTSTAMNFVPIFGFLYYLLKYEKNKPYKKLFGFLIVMFLIYNFGLGQRTVYLIAFIGLSSAYILDVFIFKKKKISKKVLAICLVIIALFIIVLLAMLSNDDIVEKLWKIRIFAKFLYYGASSNRIDIFIDSVKLMPNYLWGGNGISDVIGIMPHDLWLDVYDWAGIIPFLLLVVYTIIVIYEIRTVYVNKNLSTEYKIIIIPLFACIIVQMLLEPIMRGAPLFMVMVVMFESLIERLNYGE